MITDRQLAAIALAHLLKKPYIETFTTIVEQYGTLEEALSALPDTTGNRTAENKRPVGITAERRKEALRLAQREAEFMERENITPLLYTDAGYPKLLRECDDAPAIIYRRGNADLNSPHIISIVGTRHATPYGKEFCEHLVADLAKSLPDIIICSGLAYGIDICAHRTALDRGIATVAVLGHPLDTVYPSTHASTARKIEEHGALITEYTSDRPIQKMNFVARNRIVAGMSHATIVIESGEKGGSLITADMAAGYDREVFALPGDIHAERSKGCNELIKKNKAALITSASDITDAMHWETQSAPQNRNLFTETELDENEAAIMTLFDTRREYTTDEIAELCNLPVSTAISTLMGLEFIGLIKSYPGNRYRKF